jgi:uncharacterized membrane protein (DUF485 family)
MSCIMKKIERWVNLHPHNQAFNHLVKHLPECMLEALNQELQWITVCFFLVFIWQWITVCSFCVLIWQRTNKFALVVFMTVKHMLCLFLWKWTISQIYVCDATINICELCKLEIKRELCSILWHGQTEMKCITYNQPVEIKAHNHYIRRN